MEGSRDPCTIECVWRRDPLGEVQLAERPSQCKREGQQARAGIGEGVRKDQVGEADLGEGSRSIIWPFSAFSTTRRTLLEAWSWLCWA